MPHRLVTTMDRVNREKQFRAYELLRELDMQTTATMSQVAYGHISGAEWDYVCSQHRKGFEHWMAFAATIDKPD